MAPATRAKGVARAPALGTVVVVAAADRVEVDRVAVVVLGAVVVEGLDELVARVKVVDPEVVELPDSVLLAAEEAEDSAEEAEAEAEAEAVAEAVELAPTVEAPVAPVPE